MEKLMNKMDVMEMDKVSGGFRPNHIFRPFPRCHDSNANSMVATRGLPPVGHLPVAGGHKITFETQNASACVGK